MPLSTQPLAPPVRRTLARTHTPPPSHQRTLLHPPRPFKNTHHTNKSVPGQRARARTQSTRPGEAQAGHCHGRRRRQRDARRRRGRPDVYVLAPSAFVTSLPLPTDTSIGAPPSLLPPRHNITGVQARLACLVSFYDTCTWH